MKIPLQEECRSDAIFLLNRFINSGYLATPMIFLGRGLKKIIEYLVIFLIPVPEKSSQKGLLLLSAAGGAAGTGILDFLQVANDLGSAFLDGLAIGTHHKAA